MKTWLLAVVGLCLLSCSAAAQAPGIPPTVASTSTPDTTALCQAAAAFIVKDQAARDYYTANLANMQYAVVRGAPVDRWVTLVRDADSVSVPVPPPAARPEAQKLYDALRAYQAASDREVAAVRAENNRDQGLATADRLAAGRDLTAYRDVVCP